MQGASECRAEVKFPVRFTVVAARLNLSGGLAGKVARI